MGVGLGASTGTGKSVESPEFSISQARSIVRDLFTPRLTIYFTDFLVTWFVGVVCFRLVREFRLFSLGQIAVFIASCLLYYRAGLFIHEIIHRRDDSFRWFSFAWNLLCGIPFLIPSFVYYTHHDHHRRKYYGTDRDGEYIALASQSPSQILIYLAQAFVIPILAIFRFGVLTPLTWVCRPLRDWVHRHASSMIMDPTYIRPLPTKRVLRIMRLQEFGCFLFILFVAVMVLRGRVPLFILIQAYCTAFVVITLNAIRTLGAHHWASGGHEMTFVGQMLDSVNYARGTWLAGLWAPVGLRFHALHHVFPSMPYHNMAEAHRRLMRDLPPDSPYRLTESISLTGVIGHLCRRASRAAKRRNRSVNDSSFDTRQRAQ